MTFISIHSILSHHSTVKQGKHTADALSSGPSYSKPSLIQVAPGRKAKVLSISPRISAERRLHLQAYGLMPGHWVQVIRHSPVTVLKIDHLELALEADLAGEILVDEGG